MLYIVGTPIGNLSDLSLRQAQTISTADIILTEDTRSTGILLSKIKELFNFKINPKQRLISYYREKEFEKLPEVLKLLEGGNDVVLISESGMPLISDPGELLVKEVIKRNIPYTVVPGPTAAITALIHSGFRTNKFMFLGFLPKKESELIKSIDRIKRHSEIDKDLVYIFYESPKRISKTLELLDQNVPNADVVICRELTKKFEEIVRGTAGVLISKKYKGELAIVLSLHKNT